MFGSFSLCPGGAFMMCESVAEFDPNVPDPVTQDLVNNVEGETAVAMTQEVTSCDPVAKLMGKLTPAFEKIDGILNDTRDINDPESAVAYLDHLGTVANEIADLMRVVLVKQKAFHSMCCTRHDCEWVNSELRTHLGTFIKAGPLLKQKGYDTTSYTYSVIPCLTETYPISKVLRVYTGMQECLPDVPFDFDNLRDMMSRYGTYLDAFANTYDLFSCLFKDHERCARLEKDIKEPIDIVNLIDDCIPRASGYPVAVENDTDDIYCYVIAYVSRMLRMVKKAIYNAQCDIMDGKEVDPTKINKIGYGICDMFFVPGLVAFSVAYNMRGATARRTAITEYVKSTMQTLNLR